MTPDRPPPASAEASPRALPRIVLATNNAHKVAELATMFSGVASVIALSEALPPGTAIVEPDETGDTFEANAAIKALAYAKLTGLPCLADDSGLEVDALGGKPGVISSHYCTNGQPTTLDRADRDEANNVRLLGELLGVPTNQRTARFVCVMALAVPSARGAAGEAAADARVLATVRGSFEGRIGSETDVPRGWSGFGYDPLFLVAQDFVRTSAELSPVEKNRLSHRAAAAKDMARHITRLSTDLGQSA